MVKTDKLWPVFSRIESRADAIQTIQNASLFFNILVGAYAADIIRCEGLASRGYYFPDGTIVFMFVHMVIYAAGAFFLRRSNSRILAMALLSITFLSIVNAWAWITSQQNAAVLSFTTLVQLLALWGSVRAVEATVKLRSRFANNVSR
jgi:hypothetical protein